MSDEPGQYSLSDPTWPGISKLAEEAGEVVQVIGKIMGAHGREIHYDGSDLRYRLLEEMADLMAAAEFVLTKMTEPGSKERKQFLERVDFKHSLFEQWRKTGQ